MKENRNIRNFEITINSVLSDRFFKCSVITNLKTSGN